MGERYRKVYPKLWSDPAFVGLTAARRVLCLYILSGPQTNRAGLFNFSPGQACEDLNVSLGAIRDDLAAVCAAFGWWFDPASRVLWIPSWWRYNPPESPNVLVGALADLSEVREHPFWEGFRQRAEDLPDTMRARFLERCPTAPAPVAEDSARVPETLPPTLPKGSGNPPPNPPEGFREPSPQPSPIQDQEQDQEQEHDLSPAARAREEPDEDAFRRAGLEAERAGAFVRWYAEDAYPRLRGRPYVLKPVRDFDNALPLVRAFPDDARLRRAAEFYLSCDHRDAQKGSRTVGQFAALASWCDEQVGTTDATGPPGGALAELWARFREALATATNNRIMFDLLRGCTFAKDDGPGEAIVLVAPSQDLVDFARRNYGEALAAAAAAIHRELRWQTADEVAA